MRYVFFIVLFASTQAVTALIYNLRGSRRRDNVRHVLLYVPLALPMIWYGLPNISVAVNPFAYLTAIGAVLVALSFRFRKIRLALDPKLIELLPDMDTSVFIQTEATLIGSAILEEVFYRFYVPSANLVIGWILSASLFAVAHVLHRVTRRRLSRMDLITLAGLGAAWYGATIIGHSLLPAIIGHLVYNGPKSLAAGLQYRKSRNQDLTDTNLVKY